jgi:uncharacterized protein (DUF1697 family)
LARFVGLLRGINVGGNRMVAMADLRDCCTKLGLKDAATLLQSGNLVFAGGAARPAALEKRLEKGVRERFGFDVDFMVRTSAEWTAIIAANPFRKEALADPAHVLVFAFKDEPAPAALAAVGAAGTFPEQMRQRGRELYVTFPNGIGKSTLWKAAAWRKLTAAGTARNWNTVLKLAALVAGA